MLPPEMQTDQLAQIKARFEGGKNFEGCQEITSDDIAMIGSFVSSYSFIELNLRRSIDLFSEKEMLILSPKQHPNRLKPYELVPAVKNVVATMDPSVEDIADTQARLQELEFRRTYRNLFAHWAPLRFEDALVFASRSSQDSEQVKGEPLAYGAVATAFMMPADVSGLLAHIKGYEKWIAIKTSTWWARYS